MNNTVSDEQIVECALAAGFAHDPSRNTIWVTDGGIGVRVTRGLRDFARALLALKAEQPAQLWEVWWGVGQMQMHPTRFATKAEAESLAAIIRSNTEVRPVQQPAAQGEPLGYIPTDAIDQIRQPNRIITNSIPVQCYAADGYTAIYTRPSPAAQVPEGWQLVPIEPTLAMRDAYHSVTDDQCTANGIAGAHWNAMLSASPKPPEPPAQARGKPYAYAVHFPDEQREELVHTLDDLLGDMTNCRHTVIELFDGSSTQPAQAVEQAEKVGCRYPDCNCPFDASADPNWCAKGLPHMAAPKDQTP